MEKHVVCLEYNDFIAGDSCLISVNSGHWMVLIDAAKGSSTCPPDLSKYKADFVVVSFYKVFMIYRVCCHECCCFSHYYFVPSAIWISNWNWSSYCSKR